MDNWKYYCEECGKAIKIGFKYCARHKDLAEPKPQAFEMPPNTTGHAGRGCKDD